MCDGRIEVPARPTQELRLASRAGVDVRYHRYAAHLIADRRAAGSADFVTGLVPGDNRNQLREVNGWVDGLPLSLMVIDPFLEDLTGVWQRRSNLCGPTASVTSKKRPCHGTLLGDGLRRLEYLDYILSALRASQSAQTLAWRRRRRTAVIAQRSAPKAGSAPSMSILAAVWAAGRRMDASDALRVAAKTPLDARQGRLSAPLVSTLSGRRQRRHAPSVSLGVRPEGTGGDLARCSLSGGRVVSGTPVRGQFRQSKTITAMVWLVA